MTVTGSYRADRPCADLAVHPSMHAGDAEVRVVADGTIGECDADPSLIDYEATVDLAADPDSVRLGHAGDHFVESEGFEPAIKSRIGRLAGWVPPDPTPRVATGPAIATDQRHARGSTARSGGAHCARRPLSMVRSRRAPTRRNSFVTIRPPHTHGADRRLGVDQGDTRNVGVC